MPDNNTLSISTAVYLDGFQSGFPKAAQVVEQNTAKMQADFEAAMSAMRTEVEGLKGQLGTMEEALRKGSEAHRRHAGEARESQHAMRELGSEIGIRLPRGIATWLSSMGPVQAVMTAAFTPIMVYGLVEVLAELPKKLQDGIDKLHGWNEEAKKDFRESIQFVHELQKATEEAATAVNRAKLTEGREGAAKIAGEAESRNQDLLDALKRQHEAQQRMLALSADLKQLKSAYDPTQQRDVFAAAGALVSQHSDREKIQMLLDQAKKEYDEARIAVVHASGARQVGDIKDRVALRDDAKARALEQLEIVKDSQLQEIDARKHAIDTLFSLQQISSARELADLQAAAEQKMNVEIEALERRKAIMLRYAKPGERTDTELAKLNAGQEKARLDYGKTADELAADAEKRLRQFADEAAKLTEEFNRGTVMTITDEWGAATTEFVDYQKAVKDGSDSLGRLQEEGRRRQEEARREVESAQISHEQRMRSLQEARIHEALSLGLISGQQEIALLRQIEQAAYAAETAVASARYNDAVAKNGAGSPEAIQAQAQLQQLADAHAHALEQLNQQAQKFSWVTTMRKQVGDVSTAFTSAFSQMLEHQKSFGAALSASFRKMADDFILNLIRMQTQRLLSDAIMRTSAEKQALIQAKSSAVHAFKSVYEAVPFPVNVVLAPVVAAATFAGAMSLATFEQGGVVPRTGIKLVHEGERVLTKDQTSRFEQALSGGGNGGIGTQINYHAAPGESPDSVMRNSDALKRAFRDGRLRLPA